MPFTTLLFTALGVSMDAVAVSVSGGMAPTPSRHRQALRFALWFGAFQALMPAVGFAIGTAFRDWIAAVDHWVAFGLLCAIGVRMIWEATHPADDPEAGAGGPTAARMAVLAFATSVDALAVGLSLSLLKVNVAAAVAMMGLTTAALCYPAAVLGRRLGARFSTRAEIAGGVMLVAIGARILVEHTLLG